MTITALVTGRIAPENPVHPFFRLWMEEAATRPGVRIVWARWVGDEADYAPFEALDNLEFVTLEDDPTHWSRDWATLNGYRQHRQMAAAAQQIDDDDWVIRLRPDVYLSWDILSDILTRLGERKAWVPWANALAPYFMADYLFVTRGRTIKRWQSYDFDAFRPLLSSLPDWMHVSYDYPLDLGTHASFFCAGDWTPIQIFEFHFLSYVARIQCISGAFGDDAALLQHLLDLAGPSYAAYFDDLNQSFLISDSRHVLFASNRNKALMGRYMMADQAKQTGDIRQNGRLRFRPRMSTLYDSRAATAVRKVVTRPGMKAPTATRTPADAIPRVVTDFALRPNRARLLAVEKTPVSES